MNKRNNSNIYFLENIIPHYAESPIESSGYSIVLLEASAGANIDDIPDRYDLNDKDNHEYRYVEKVSNQQIANIHEGQYVFYYDRYDGPVFENANSDNIAKRNIILNNLLRGLLIKKQRPKDQEIKIAPDSRIYSYHINVGHGNCSIIVIQDSNEVKLWMVDCSDFDYKNKEDHQSQINACFSHIKDRFHIDKIFIEKFFLTHAHYDHYSGVSRLLDGGILNGNTEFLMNLHYSMPSENYNRLLRKIHALSPSIIEPTFSLNQNWIEVWHPHTRTIRSKTVAYVNQNVTVEPKINNSSVIYFFKLGQKTMLFPGDIETERWNTVNSCYPCLRNTDYYIISHHGSLNGHLRNQCPHSRYISNLSDCVGSFATPILMGKDGSYSGIYSRKVIQDFNCNIAYSEKDMNGNTCQFLEIDWQTNQKQWL